ncbi:MULTISPECIES: MarC family protein [unclassified Undibacterium]|uniref:MarC family protein n=1 Tax=unclassified Undibacterium TaxID=2630295 RepID=UPI002AC8E362|nr:MULTISPECIES: MarC family protein [unclassified Undibacterium]MEB0140274.1 MarC family protein [Undibacterium sp. CCC2.1]MEB0173312.1 MarC family protein [Undibacterium sp. CCC1.1]MEB0177131.1 MarC family protein [Undibacterium sp. CCC3.4]MEB0216413.1 MarC family protein [Undibacterium sp. 5I2]WPX45533.1 MarC family protein [Undibacterium sp. CCC3.4]
MSIALTVFFKALVVVPVTVLPILNPIAIAPIFLSMTGPIEPQLANRLAKRIALNCFFLLLGAIFIGSYVLDFFGISIPIVRVAGGIVVSMAGWKLLNDQSQDKLLNSVAATHGGSWSREELRTRSFYPFSFPLTVGPGTIAAAVALGAQMPHKPVDWLVTGIASAIGVLLTTLVVYLCYRFARNMERFLGDIGATVVLRLSAFILLCIGISIGWAGISDLISELPLNRG